MLEDAYRGERATPAIQCVIGQKPRCILDDRDEAFPYSLEHLIDRLVGQQTVPPYRYIHPLCSFVLVSEGRGADILALFLLLKTYKKLLSFPAPSPQPMFSIHTCGEMVLLGP